MAAAILSTGGSISGVGIKDSRNERGKASVEIITLRLIPKEVWPHNAHRHRFRCIAAREPGLV
jgi:hypothetical protein